jgi:hypothetical protein
MEKMRLQVIGVEGLHIEQSGKITELTTMLKDKMGHIKELTYQIDEHIIEKDEWEKQNQVTKEKFREQERNVY